MKRLFYILMAAMALVAGACSDDSFTTSRKYLLSFSTDTLTMDTVFSGVPSSTYSFMVYNRNDKALRINQARLMRGNQTGFRVNVDGQYLDNANGSQAQDFEVRGGDSLRVFVELTSFQANSDVPEVVEDELLFVLESGEQQRIPLRAHSWDAICLRDLKVSRDTTITALKPIVVYGGIRVDSGAVLKVISPANLYFHYGAGIDVYGRLVVEGRQGDEVVMRGDRLDHMFDYLPYDRVSGQWRGIRFMPSSTRNEITYADIHSADDALVCDSAAFDPTECRLSLTNATIHNCNGYGLSAVSSYVKMVNCQVSNTFGDCISVVGGRLEVTYTTVAQFYPFSADRGAAISFCGLETLAHRGSMECVNSVFTGYYDDVMMGDTLMYDFQFTNCFIRTPEIADTVFRDAHFKDVVFESPVDSCYGKKHFVCVDIDRQYYDFHLDSLSALHTKALPLEAVRDDRDGKMRGTEPTIGCYEGFGIKD